jgi:RND family efflux transporter MFP subunit
VLLAGGAAAWRWHYGVPRVVLGKAVLVVPEQELELQAASGHLIARRQATVVPDSLQVLTECLVEVGDEVDGGQLLGRLEHSELDAEITEIEVRIEEARLRLSREQSLAGEGLSRREDLDTAEYALRALQSRRDTLQARLEKTFLRAPFAGRVIDRSGEIGTILGPVGFSDRFGVSAGSLCTIADLESLEVELHVAETGIHRVRPGCPVRIELDALPGERFPGRVAQILPRADRQRGTVPVRVTLDDHDPRFVPGLSARAVILDEEPADFAASPYVTAPLRALRIHGGFAEAFQVLEARAGIRRVYLEIGKLEGDRVRVETGLEGGELLVLDPPEDLEDGDRIRIAEP